MTWDQKASWLSENDEKSYGNSLSFHSRAKRTLAPQNNKRRVVDKNKIAS